MDSSPALLETHAPAMEPSSDSKSECNPQSFGKPERDHTDEPELLSLDLETLKLDPPERTYSEQIYSLRNGPISLALLTYKFKSRAPGDVLRKCCTVGDSADPLEGSCPFCCGGEGEEPLEHPKVELSSDEEAIEG